ncbi:unnamed protein product [Urochloa humidicola]
MFGRGSSPTVSDGGGTGTTPPRRSTRSPPSPASPIPQAHQAPAAGSVRGGEEGRTATATEPDEEEEFSVESDDLTDGPEYVEVWVREGDWERASHYAYVELVPVTAAANPAPIIRGALLRAAPALRYQILPSAHGVALLYFHFTADREEAMLLQPLDYHGTLVKIGRIEDTDDRFVRQPSSAGISLRNTGTQIE